MEREKSIGKDATCSLVTKLEYDSSELSCSHASTHSFKARSPFAMFYGTKSLLPERMASQRQTSFTFEAC